MLDQLREIKLEPSALLLEPIGRNTAPALTLAAQDVAPFPPATEQASLTLRSERFFADKISKLVQAVSADA